MAKRFFYVCAGLLCLALTFHVGARRVGAEVVLYEFVTGERLKRMFDEPQAGESRAYNMGFGLGYISGVIDADRLKNGGGLPAVWRYLDSHPEQLDGNAADLVRAALRPSSHE